MPYHWRSKMLKLVGYNVIYTLTPFFFFFLGLSILFMVVKPPFHHYIKSRKSCLMKMHSSNSNLLLINFTSWCEISFVDLRWKECFCLLLSEREKCARGSFWSPKAGFISPCLGRRKFITYGRKLTPSRDNAFVPPKRKYSLSVKSFKTLKTGLKE